VTTSLTLFSVQKQSSEYALVLIAGFIHDVTSFLDEHPSGKHLLVKNIRKETTTACFDGVYDRSIAAHNPLTMKRIGVLHGGHPHVLDDKTSFLKGHGSEDATAPLPTGLIRTWRRPSR
jgi:cytochrome b involved in lipid metabolism